MVNNSCTVELSEMKIFDNEVIDVNYHLLELTGYEKIDLVGKSLLEIKALFKSDFLFVKKANNRLESEFIFTKQGFPRHVSIEVETAAENKVIIYRFEKLSDYKFEAKFSGALEILSRNNCAMAVYHAPSLKLLRANEKHIDFFYRSFDEGENIDYLGSKINEVNNWFWSISYKIWEEVIGKNEQYYEEEKKYCHTNGNTVYYSYNVIPISEGGRVEYLINISHNKTEEVLNRSNLEKAILKQEEFFSYIAHEFKTPLTVTYSAIQLLDYFCNEELSERAKRFINKIRQSSLQQLRLVNNLLDITKADSGYLKLNKRNYDIVFMTEAIVNSVLLIGREKGIGLIFTSTFETKFILIDDEKYERILLNILSNAIKFTPCGKNIYVDLFVNDRQINVRVKDEGIGIPEDKQNIIFDRFGQVDSGLIRNAEGTGIGLCLAKILANALGGDILLKSELGVGSEFTIVIPDISAPGTVVEKEVHNHIEERLIQSVNVEFSTIYQ